MNTARFALVLAAILSVTALVAACGGDDDDNGGSQTSNTPSEEGDDGVSEASGDGPEIRTTKGLSVAAVNAGFGPQGGGSGGDEARLLSGDIATTGGTSGAAGSGPAAGAPAPVAPDARDSSSVNAQAGAGGGITVTGYGTASAEADSAILEFYFGNNGGNPSGTPVAPITEADLQPVIDALVAAGIAREDIEVVNQGYYDPYYRSASLRAKVRDVNIVESAAQAASDAAGGLSGFSLQSTNITFTLSDCAAMERASLEAATDDAADHGALLAEVLGVGLGPIVAASNQSYPYYWGYGGLEDGVCASTYYGAIPFFSGAAIGGSRTVDVFGYVSVTYAIQ